MTTVTTLKKEMYTNRELATLLGGLFDVQELKGVRFALQVSKNINLLQSELEAIEKAAAPDPEFVVLANQVQALEKANDEEAIKKLEEKNPKLIEDRKSQISEFNKVMEEEAELFLFKISENHLPKDITAKQLNNIQLILKE